MKQGMNHRMSRQSQFIVALGRPLGVLVLALAIGGAFVYWSAQRSGEARQIFERENAARNQARDRLARVDEEQRIIERYGPAYQVLIEEGIVGAEQRVNWLDALRLASRVTRGFGVDYQVSGQTISQAGDKQGILPKLDAGAYETQQSEMTLRLRLLHEGDLLAFLDALDEQRAGLHLLHECSLQRANAGPFTARFEPKLLAECKLTWVTLDDRPVKGEQ
jgi:hypothetical protein